MFAMFAVEVDMWKFLRSDASAVLNNERVKASLRRYFAVMQNEKSAKFMVAKRVPADFRESDPLKELWRKHNDLTKEFYEFEKEIDSEKKNLLEMQPSQKSYLDLKIEIANRILSQCHFCKRRCRVNRLNGELGFCKCSTEITISSIFEHIGEEPELVPSGTIFTMGCTMRCRHCQNWTTSQWKENGEVYKPEELAKEVEHLRLSGCRNANLVGGEPTPWLQQWLETFKHVNVNIPIVWNSNTYYSSETAKLLAGFVDVYLLDFKYGPSECALKISNAPGYWNVCTYNHLEAKEYGELIVRVLVLPNHMECCTKPILDWISQNLGTGTRVNVMFQYRPEWRAYETPDLRRRLTSDEMERAIQIAQQAKLKNFIT